MENRNICIIRLNDIQFTYLVQLYNIGLRFRDNTWVGFLNCCTLSYLTLTKIIINYKKVKLK